MPLIIPFFIMNGGCPHRCIFCNQEKTAGARPDPVSAESFRGRVLSHLRSCRKRPDDVQIAFYGGNFTGLDPEEQRELLEQAGRFIGAGLIRSVRISTRPDHIDEDRLALLKKYGVRTIEIGAQSMVDGILSAAGRGHSAGDVERAVRLIRRRGFEAGVHLMAGLPGEGREHFEYSVERVIHLRPDMVRIHPTIVLAETPLEKLFRAGDYEPLSLPDAVALCKHALRRFGVARIPVIRVGLQSTPEMEKPGSIVAGPYHPAFRSLVESSMFLDTASSLLSAHPLENQMVTFSTAPCDVSRMRGLKNENILDLQRRFGLKGLSVAADPRQERDTLRLAVGG